VVLAITPPRVTATGALVPLRLFLGGTFFYAGFQKLSDPGFLHSDAPTYIGTQLHGFADGTPAGGLLQPALAHPELAGIAVAVVEIAIGILVLLGFMTRLAAAAGLALNLVLFLTASWHTSPYFLGSDIVFVFAWLPFVLVGSEGQPTVCNLLSRRSVGVRQGATLTRRAMFTHVLAFVGVVTASTAAVASVARGTYDPPAPARSRREADLGSAQALGPGQARPYTDPVSGAPAIAIRGRDGTLAAMSAVCTHAGCELTYRKDQLMCPCHGSTFDVRTGAPMSGPARKPLAMASVSEQNGRIVASPLRPAS